jgi:hypothetical protein
MTTYEQVVELIARKVKSWVQRLEFPLTAWIGIVNQIFKWHFTVNGKTYRLAIVEDVRGILSRDTCADMVINPHCYPRELKDGE